ncbi:MAG TPA: hypothetical protein VHN20_09310 [Beijerinckiaceae bacterium]|nr:hypothetical protein [Beijerinckiaceae bacterium]
MAKQLKHPKRERIDRWVYRAQIALGGALVALLVRLVEMFRRPDRDQTLALYMTLGLIVITTACLLGLLLRRKHVRAGIDVPPSQAD